MDKIKKLADYFQKPIEYFLELEARKMSKKCTNKKTEHFAECVVVESILGRVTVTLTMSDICWSKLKKTEAWNVVLQIIEFKKIEQSIEEALNLFNEPIILDFQELCGKTPKVTSLEKRTYLLEKQVETIFDAILKGMKNSEKTEREANKMNRIDIYKTAIDRVKARSRNDLELHIAIDAIREVALRDRLSDGLDDKEYGQICVLAADAEYPEKQND